MEVSEHIPYIREPLTKVQQMHRLKCHIILFQNMFIFPLSQSQRMLIGLSRACSHRHDTKETAQTLTAHISAVSVLPVLETGLSRTKSGPDLGERTSGLREESLTGKLASKSNISTF